MKEKVSLGYYNIENIAIIVLLLSLINEVFLIKVVFLLLFNNCEIEFLIIIKFLCFCSTLMEIPKSHKNNLRCFKKFKYALNRNMKGALYTF